MQTLTIENLKTLETQRPFEKFVINHLIRNNVDDMDLNSYVKEVITYGCKSLQLEKLSTIADMVKIYNKYEEDIVEIATIVVKETNLKLCELIKGYGDKHNTTEENQRLLTWFVIEEIMYQLKMNS